MKTCDYSISEWQLMLNNCEIRWGKDRKGGKKGKIALETGNYDLFELKY